MSLQDSRQLENVKVLLKVGADGRGIAEIVKVGTSGIVDTYDIVLSDGTRFPFDVTNGSSIETIEKTATVGLVDTYTITLTNGDTFEFEVTNADGSTAGTVGYDNTDSGLDATNVQDAIDEVNERVDTALTLSEVLVATKSSVSSLPTTISDANIEDDMICINSELSNPSAQLSDWTVTTATGSLTISGTISGTTNITLYLMKSR